MMADDGQANLHQHNVATQWHLQRGSCSEDYDDADDENDENEDDC